MRLHLLLSSGAALALFLPVLGCGEAPDDDDGGTPGDLDAIISEERPSKRSEVVAVAHEGTNSILMFGGNDAPIVNQIARSQYRDDTWVFEPGYGWSSIDDSGPGARGRYGATLDTGEGRALVFGGRYREAGADSLDPYTLFNDLWAFDFTSRTWDRLHNGGSDAPRARYYPGVAWVESESALYVFGGLTNTSPTNFAVNQELWRWTEAEGWLERPTSGDAPPPRAFFGSTFDSERGRLILFAGQVGDFESLAYNDLYALDLASGEWRELHGGGSSAPYTRMHPHIQYDASRDRIVLFGGHTDIGDGNDLWEFPAGGDDWTLLTQGDRFTGAGFGCQGNQSEVPADYVDQDLSAPERRQKAMVALMYDNLWLFGGMHAECSEHLDDTWRFDLGQEEWTELIEARTGESCLRRNDDCDCLCL